MSVGRALIIAVSGFMVVFLMLCILWGIIVAINKVTSMIEGKTTTPEAVPQKAAEAPAAAAPAAKAAADAVYGGEVALFDVDEKTAACIMAIISDETKIPLNQLIFKSIRALN